ncbi:MAG: hypothetical protein ACHP9Y_01205 [Gammaproteobacteria bacterium]
MEQKSNKKPALYNEINELLSEYGESMTAASQNPLFRQRVAQQILDLFSPTATSAFALETTRAILESFQKGAIDSEDIYLLRDFVVEWQKHVEEEEENLSLHEMIGILLKAGSAGESVADAAKALLNKGVVADEVLGSYQ